MKDGPLYLCLIEKEKRVRIKICFEGSFAKVILVTCHTPKNAGMPFTWERKSVIWNLEKEKDRKEFEGFIFGCQKEGTRNFKAAMEEAVKFNKRMINQKKPSCKKKSGDKVFKGSAVAKTTTSRFVGHIPLVPKEEIINKILKLQAGHS